MQTQRNPGCCSEFGDFVLYVIFLAVREGCRYFPSHAGNNRKQKSWTSHVNITVFRRTRCPLRRGTLKLRFSSEEQQRGNAIAEGEPCLRGKCELLCTAQGLLFCHLGLQSPVAKLKVTQISGIHCNSFRF